MRLQAKQTEIVRSQFGDLVAYTDDLITQQIQEFGNHTRPEFAFALSALDFEMSLFDLGAHIGTFSVAALNRMSNRSRLLAVEGSPDTFDLLRQNCEGRGEASVDLLNTFVGEDLPVHFSEDHANTGGSRLEPTQSGMQESIALTPIDTLVEQYFEPDYIKIDIEGAEYNAVSGSSYIADDRPILYLEASPHLAHFGHDLRMLNDLLQGLDYGFFVNIGDRNARHDVYRIGRLRNLHHYLQFFDVLCIPKNTELHDVFMRSSTNIIFFRSQIFVHRTLRKLKRKSGLG